MFLPLAMALTYLVLKGPVYILINVYWCLLQGSLPWLHQWGREVVETELRMVTMAQCGESVTFGAKQTQGQSPTSTQKCSDL